MLSQSQYLTPDRGRQGGLSGLKDGLGGGLSPRGPQELFGLGGARSPTQSSLGSPTGEESIYRNEINLGVGVYSSNSVTGLPVSDSNTGYPSAHQNTSWATKADYAMNAPTIWQKCTELGPILTGCPVKELHVIWKSVVERIFCLGGGRGWGVSNTLRSQHPREYQAIAAFLSSTGPLLSACHRLLADPYIRYEFPVSRLSQTINSQISAGGLSNFLASRLAPGGQQLVLNSFEYYMFTFSVYIVQPYTLDNRLVAGESLYPYILEDYLSYYLPCDGTTPPPLPFQLSLPSSPGQSLSPQQQQLQNDQSSYNTTPARKSLLRHPSLLSSTPVTPRPTPTPSSLLPSGDQTWRSETILSIFTCAWLTQFSSNSSSPSSATSSELPIPVSDTLKIVRMLIKHLHYFSNSGGPSDVTPLDQLKRATLPGVKTQMYKLFKYIFGHWPHDTSFRLVLETWLSYIQPWRYTDRGRPVAESDPAPVDERWQGWVAENILMYSEVLKLLVPRFFRMDLTASKNAYMLFRIAKVFSQAGLTELIRTAESGLDRSSSGRMMPSLLDSASIDEREGVASAARACLLELEGQGAKYSPVFGNEFRQLVGELLANAERANDAASEMLKELDSVKGKVESEGTLVGIIQWLLGNTRGEQDSQEVDELKKTVQHLTASLGSLTEVFSLAIPRSDQIDGGRRPQVGNRSINEPEMVETENGLVLTPHGRWQVVQGLAKPVIRYEGDPDLCPITHGEVVWLVRLFYQASLWLNKRWAVPLHVAWNDVGVWGRLARMILAPPTHYYTVTKSISGGPAARQLHRHNARICLRPLASKKVLLYLSVYCCVMGFAGYSITSSITSLLFFSALIMFIIAFIQSLTKTNPSLLDTSDIAFEEECDAKKQN